MRTILVSTATLIIGLLAGGIIANDLTQAKTGTTKPIVNIRIDPYSQKAEVVFEKDDVVKWTDSLGNRLTDTLIYFDDGIPCAPKDLNVGSTRVLKTGICHVNSDAGVFPFHCIGELPCPDPDFEVRKSDHQHVAFTGSSTPCIGTGTQVINLRGSGANLIVVPLSAPRSPCLVWRDYGAQVTEIDIKDIANGSSNTPVCLGIKESDGVAKLTINGDDLYSMSCPLNSALPAATTIPYTIVLNDMTKTKVPSSFTITSN